MYHTLAKKLALDTTGSLGASTEYSQPVSLPTESNAVRWDATMFELTATNVAFQLQTSNDLENWADEGKAILMNTIGHAIFATQTDLAAAYVRLKYAINGSGVAVLAVGINTSEQ